MTFNSIFSAIFVPEILFLWIKKITFLYPVLFFEICRTYDGLVSKALPLRIVPGRLFSFMVMKKALSFEEKRLMFTDFFCGIFSL